MKTQAIEWSPLRGRDSRIVLNPGYSLPRQLHGALSLAARALLALVAAAAVVVAAAWLVTLPEFAPYLQAAIWAGGFVFVALAVESDSPLAALLLLATGIAMPALAWLSSRVAVELALVAAALVAVWAAAAIFRR
jgi:hypothetical protein